jgi:hypothetical protein
VTVAVPGPRIQFGAAENTVALPLIGGGDDAPQLEPLRRGCDRAQVDAFGGGRIGQCPPVRLRHRGVQKGVPVGSPVHDRLVQGSVVAGLLGRRAAADNGQRIWQVAGLNGHHRGDTVGVQRQPQVEKCRAAGDPQFPVLGIVTDQPTTQVGVDLDPVRAEPEPPRLGVEQ